MSTSPQEGAGNESDLILSPRLTPGKSTKLRHNIRILRAKTLRVMIVSFRLVISIKASFEIVV